MGWRIAPPGHPDREVAGFWADVYRKAMAEPDGVLDLGRDEDGCSLGQVDAKNPDTLVRLLENFEKHGTFERPRKDRGKGGSKMFERMMLKLEFQSLRNKGLTKEDAIGLLSEKYSMRGRGYSESSVERKLGFRK